MNGIKYYALDENEEAPYEFVVIRNVNGEPELYASFVNTDSLAYGNGVLLKFHQRNDELRAENAKLRTQLADVTESMGRVEERCAKLRKLVRDMTREHECCCLTWPAAIADRMRELGIEVE